MSVPPLQGSPDPMGWLRFRQDSTPKAPPHLAVPAGPPDPMGWLRFQQQTPPKATPPREGPSNAECFVLGTLLQVTKAPATFRNGPELASYLVNLAFGGIEAIIKHGPAARGR